MTLSSFVVVLVGVPALAVQSDHVYLRHLSTKYWLILSADMLANILTDTRSRLGRVSVSMLFGRYVAINSRWCIGRLSVVYQSTIGGIRVLLTDVLLK